MRFLFSAATVALALTLTAPTAIAGASCSNKTNNVNGKLGGDAFAFDTDSRAFGLGDDDNYIRLQGEDCDRFDDAKRDARRAAATAAVLDVYGLEPGLNATVNYANSGLEDDTNAAGLNLSYHLDQGTFGADAWVQGVTFTAGFASDTTGDEQMVKVGGNIAFGQLF